MKYSLCLPLFRPLVSAVPGGGATRSPLPPQDTPLLRCSTIYKIVLVNMSHWVLPNAEWLQTIRRCVGIVNLCWKRL